MVILCLTQGQVAVPLLGKNTGHLRMQPTLQSQEEISCYTKAGPPAEEAWGSWGAHFHLQMGLLKQNSQVHSSNK